MTSSQPGRVPGRGCPATGHRCPAIGQAERLVRKAREQTSGSAVAMSGTTARASGSDAVGFTCDTPPMRTASLTDAELLALLDPPARATERRALRAQAIVRLLAIDGLTADAVRALRPADFRPGVGLFVGRAVRALTTETDDLLALLVGEERLGPLLVGDRQGLSGDGLLKLVARYGETRDVQDVSPARLRRTYARRLYEQGTPLRELLALLGIRSERHLRAWLAKDPNCALVVKRRAGQAHSDSAAARSAATGSQPVSRGGGRIVSVDDPHLF